MTNKRKAQFEADRQKMLAAIGRDENEPEVEVEAEEEMIPELKAFRESLDRLAGKNKPKKSDFEERLEDLKFDNPSPAEYEERAALAFEEEMDFQDSIRGKPEAEVKKATQLRRNKRKRAKERLKEEGSADGFGVLINLLDDFQATFGGGVGFIMAVFFILTPISAYWWVGPKGSWLLGILVFLFGGIALKIACMWASYVAGAFVKTATLSGPRFICDVREGSPGTKLTVSLANKAYWLFRNAYWLFLFTTLGLCLWVLDWSAKEWITSYFVVLCWCGGGILVSCLFADIIGFPIYTGIISSALSGGKCKYRLRYLHDPSRVMIPTRGGRLVSTEERKKAFSAAYLGIA